MKHDGEFDAGASAGRVLLHIWSALEDGVKSGSPFNLLQLASMDEANKPAVRTIVLRQFRRTPGELFFVTEAGSRKVAQILLNNEVSLVGYDASTWSQIRLSGQAYVVSDEQERLLQWTKLSDRTRRSFFPCVESRKPTIKFLKRAALQLVGLDPANGFYSCESDALCCRVSGYFQRRASSVQFCPIRKRVDRWKNQAHRIGGLLFRSSKVFGSWLTAFRLRVQWLHNAPSCSRT